MAEQKDKCPECENGRIKADYGDDVWLDCPTCHGTGEKKLDKPDMGRIAKSNAVGMGLIPPDSPREKIDEIMSLVDAYDKHHRDTVKDWIREIIDLFEPLIEEAKKGHSISTIVDVGNDAFKDGVKAERERITIHLDKLCKHNPIRTGALRQELGKYIQTLKEEKEETHD